MNQSIPAISVIIPVYNEEKNIVHCLESIVLQTFKDFEIIVVDDCSTDKSVEIVEKFRKNRGGEERFKIVRQKINSGNPGTLRNKGLQISRGKYVYFIDSDDLLTKTAFEELFQTAEKYNADVLSICRYYTFETEEDKLYPDKVKISPDREFYPKDEPIFETENIGERILDMLKLKFHVMPWSWFCRRDVLIENEIFFPKILVAEDDFWSMKLICRAKKILHIPNVIYLWRENKNSLTRKEKNIFEKINYSMTPTIVGIKFMCEILNESEFLQQNFYYWYAWINRMIHFNFLGIFDACRNLPPEEVYKIFYNAFKDEMGDNAELISYLCSKINLHQKELYLANRRIQELESKLSNES